MFRYDTAIIQLGQGANDALEVHATMVDIRNNTRIVLQMEWEGLLPASTDGLPADFLYSALSQLLTNFDDHLVVGMEVSPYSPSGAHRVV